MLSNSKKLTVCVLLFLFILFALMVPTTMASYSSGEVRIAADKCAHYLQHYHQAEKMKEFIGWTPVALRSVDQDFMNSRWQGETAISRLELDMKAKTVSDLDITTSLARYIIILKAAGKDPTDYAGQNLLSGLSQSQLPSGKFPDSIKSGGDELVNAHIWSMIALATAGDSQWDRDKAVNWLKLQQHNDGGFHFITGNTDSDVDVSSAAIIALVLSGEKKDSPAVAKAINYLRYEQMPGGGFASWQTENLESAAMVMQALIVAGIDPDSAPWSKNGKKLIDIIMAYQVEDGSFPHIKGGKGNLMSSEQALMALGDYMQGKSVYQRMAQATAPTGFSDVKANDPAYAAVMKLVDRGVMTGYPDKSFRPTAAISRAEFAQALFLAQGGEMQPLPGDERFVDIDDLHWARTSIAYCARMKWMQGTDSSHFTPDQKLTGAQLLAVIVKIMGLSVNERQTGEAWYQPYVAAGSNNSLLYPGFKAESNASRGQCAMMLDKVFP